MNLANYLIHMSKNIFITSTDPSYPSICIVQSNNRVKWPIYKLSLVKNLEPIVYNSKLIVKLFFLYIHFSIHIFVPKTLRRKIVSQKYCFVFIQKIRMLHLSLLSMAILPRSISSLSISFHTKTHTFPKFKKKKSRIDKKETT